MRKYKNFFRVPLNKLPWKLPLKKETEKKNMSETERENLQTEKMKFSIGQDSGKIDQELILQILKIMQQRYYYDSERGKSASVVYILSTKAGRGNLFSSPSTYDNLDSIYNELAPQIRIQTNMKRKGLSFPVVEYGYEDYDPERHKISRVNFKRLTVDPNSPFKDRLGKLINFEVPMHHHYMNVPCGVGKRSFPDICLLLDTSGSMRNGGYHSNIPWGDKSSYHFALLGLYGIIKYLEAEGTASSIMWNVINFSDATRASGWKGYSEISELKRHALTPQFGGTEIDVEVLREELFHESCLVIILSDGEIYNWEKIKTDMGEIIQPHYTCFVQIRKETKVGKDMQDFGAVVLAVKQDEDISELMVDLTRQVKHSF
ncbi:VWA domain-containing protein [Candidatus Aerophobetes bacterium]|nr:VWA domain-containing protein [Candidatus Aerophobetes bacterium]